VATASAHQSSAGKTGRTIVAVAPSATILSATRRVSEIAGNNQLFSGPPQPTEKASTPSHPGVHFWEKKRAQRMLRAAANGSTVGTPRNWSSCAPAAAPNEKSRRSRIWDRTPAHMFETDGSHDALRETPGDATTMNKLRSSAIKAGERLKTPLMTCIATRL